MKHAAEHEKNSSRGHAGVQQFAFHTPFSVASVEAQIRDLHSSDLVETIDFTRWTFRGGERVFLGTISHAHARQRRLVRFYLRNAFGVTQQVLPADGPVPVGYSNLHMRNGQFFLYEPGEAYSAARVECFHFQPRHFPGRTIRVLLPRGYAESADRRYPVLYAQDGQNIFSPGSQFGSWDLDITARDLIARGEIPEIIVVAIDNSECRFAEYVPEYAKIRGTGGRAGEFLAMMRDELIPHINSHYRTATGPASTGHLGSSLGGLLGFHAANEFSDVFGVVAALSPSFWVNMGENLRRASRAPEGRARLWLDAGNGKEDGFDNLTRVRDAMIAKGAEIGPDFMAVLGVGHVHSEHDWRQRCPDILRWMFPPPETPPATMPLDPALLVQSLDHTPLPNVRRKRS